MGKDVPLKEVVKKGIGIGTLAGIGAGLGGPAGAAMGAAAYLLGKELEKIFKKR